MTYIYTQLSALLPLTIFKFEPITWQDYHFLPYAMWIAISSSLVLFVFSFIFFIPFSLLESCILKKEHVIQKWGEAYEVNISAVLLTILSIIVTIIFCAIMLIVMWFLSTQIFDILLNLIFALLFPFILPIWFIIKLILCKTSLKANRNQIAKIFVIDLFIFAIVILIFYLFFGHNDRFLNILSLYLPYLFSTN